MEARISAEKFEEVVGRPPEHDDLERCNCDKAGEVGHLMCGWCEQCNKPRFICGHIIRRSQITDEEIVDAEAMLFESTKKFMKNLDKKGLYEEFIQETLDLDPKEYPIEMWNT